MLYFKNNFSYFVNKIKTEIKMKLNIYDYVIILYMCLLMRLLCFFKRETSPQIQLHTNKYIYPLINIPWGGLVVYFLQQF